MRQFERRNIFVQDMTWHGRNSAARINRLMMYMIVIPRIAKSPLGLIDETLEAGFAAFAGWFDWYYGFPDDYGLDDVTCRRKIWSPISMWTSCGRNFYIVKVVCVAGQVSILITLSSANRPKNNTLK